MSDKKRSKYEEKLSIENWNAIYITAIGILAGVVIEYVINWGFTYAAEDSVASKLEPLLSAGIWALIIVILALLLLSGTGKKKKLAEEMGTVYYLRAHPQSTLAWHAFQANQLISDALDFKAINRVIPSVDENQTLYDLSEIGTSISRELEQQTNADNEHSRFQIAPDLPWPLAFRLGHQWFPRQRVEMREMNQRTPTQLVHWDYTTLAVDQAGNTSGATSNALKVRVTERHGKGPETFRETSFPCTTLTTDHVDHGPKRVKLHVQTGLNAGVNNVDTPPVGEAAPYDVVRIVGLKQINGSDDQGAADAVALQEDNAENSDIPQVDGLELSRTVAYAVAQALTDYPNATIDVVLRAPKTVAFASGMAITEIETRNDDGTGTRRSTDYWSRLRLLHFVSETEFHWLIAHELERENVEKYAHAHSEQGGKHGEA